MAWEKDKLEEFHGRLIKGAKIFFLFCKDGQPWEPLEARVGDAEMGGPHHPEPVYTLHVLNKSGEEANRTLKFAVPPTQGHFSMMRILELPERERIDASGEEEEESLFIPDEPEHVRSALSSISPSEDPFRSVSRHSTEPPRKILRAETKVTPPEDLAQVMAQAFQLMAEKMTVSTNQKAKPEFKIDDRTTWVDYTSHLTSDGEKELRDILNKTFVQGLPTGPSALLESGIESVIGWVRLGENFSDTDRSSKKSKFIKAGDNCMEVVLKEYSRLDGIDQNAINRQQAGELSGQVKKLQALKKQKNQSKIPFCNICKLGRHFWHECPKKDQKNRQSTNP